MTISQYIKELVALTKGRYEFVIVDQSIVAFMVSKRANRTKAYTLMEALYHCKSGRRRKESCRLAIALGLPYENYLDLHWACRSRCNYSHPRNWRRRWIRKLLLKAIGLQPDWTLPSSTAILPERRHRAMATFQEAYSNAS